MSKISYKALGDTAILIEFEQRIDPDVLSKVMAFDNLIRQAGLKGITELVPSYAALAVFYDPLIYHFEDLVEAFNTFESRLENYTYKGRRLWHVPVCYEGEFSPDLAEVSACTGLEKKDVVEIHQGAKYLVYMLGFLPGFIYLGGMDERIACTRKSNPSLKVAAGSVAIGGAQTGMYSIESPGGWNVIGRTPVSWFLPKAKEKFLITQGDYVKFEQVTKKEYSIIAEKISQGNFQLKSH